MSDFVSADLFEIGADSLPRYITVYNGMVLRHGLMQTRSQSNHLMCFRAARKACSIPAGYSARYQA